MLKYYQPSSKAWVAACVLFLSIVAIVCLVMASDFKVEVDSAVKIRIQNGEGAADVNIFHVQPKPKYGA